MSNILSSISDTPQSDEKCRQSGVESGKQVEPSCNQGPRTLSKPWKHLSFLSLIYSLRHSGDFFRHIFDI